MLRFKKWKISQGKDFSLISQKYSVCSLAAKVAAARKNTIGEKELFSKSDGIYSPFELKDMDRAAEKINDAVDNGLKITVYGDYDTDGVTATVILYSYLEAMGADVSFYIPDREKEGYGLNADAVKKLADEGCQLIITVDNGIAAVEEIKLAKSLGIEVVVTDHHKPQANLPDCIVVDPHRADCQSKFKDICGAFVAFKLVAALDGGDYNGAFEQYAELVAVATIADVVPLVSENRTIVRLGLEKMRETSNLGLLSLIDASLSPDAEINSNAVTYSIVPRINAAGRMGSARRAAELLICDDEQYAAELCEEICAENNRRKEIENDILEQIEVKFQKEPSLLSDRVIVVCGDGWHHGVLGIVASKVVEMTGKPALVLSNDGDSATGSGRSVEGFSLFDALCSCGDVFTKFGGHSLAVGVTLDSDKVSLFRRLINDYARDKFLYMPENFISADAVISPSEITLAAVKELSLFEPFGKDNPSPTFALLNQSVQKFSAIGNAKHTRFSLSDGKTQYTALYFGKSTDEFKLLEGRRADLLVRLKVNVYAGQQSVTVQVVSIRPSAVDDDLFFKEKQLFDAVMRKEPLSKAQAEHIMPTREQAAEVYRFIKQAGGFGDSEDMLWFIFSEKMSRAKLSVILKAFEQSNLLETVNGCLTLPAAQDKKDLFGCDILKFISGYLQK